MNIGIISGVAVVIMSLVMTGCSNDPWDKLPKNCTAQVMTREHVTWEPVPCSPPVDALTIVNESRSAHEARFGGPYEGLSTRNDFPNLIFYNGGSILIRYEKTEPTIARSMGIAPDNLDFNPQAILDFMGITDMSVEVQPSGAPVHTYYWRDDPVYGYLRALSNSTTGQDAKVLSINFYPNQSRGEN